MATFSEIKSSLISKPKKKTFADIAGELKGVKKEQPIPSTVPREYVPTPIALTKVPPVEKGVSPVLPVTEKDPSFIGARREPPTIKSTLADFGGMAKSVYKVAKQLTIEGLPKAVGQVSYIPELTTKAIKASLKGVNKIVDSPKVKNLVNRLQVFDDDIDEWQASWRELFDKKDKTRAEVFGAFIGEEVAPFFLGSEVVSGLEKATSLGKVLSKIKSPTVRSIFRGTLTDIGVQPSISLAQNESPEEAAKTFAVGIALGAFADVLLGKLIKKTGKEKVKEAISDALFESQKAISRGATAQEAEQIYKQIFKDKIGREARIVELKGLGKEADEIRLRAERQVEKEKAILEKEKVAKKKKFKKIPPKEFAEKARKEGFKSEKVKIDEVIQTRTKPSEGIVKSNIEKLKRGEKLEPVIISKTGRIVDGNHRFEALKRTGAKEIEVLRRVTVKPKIIKAKPVKQIIRKVTGQVKSTELRKLITKLTRKQVVSNLRLKTVNLREAKNTVIKYAKENLPKDKAGKISLARAKQVLTAIKDANTKKSLAKSLVKVDKIVSSIKRAENIKSIRKAVKETKVLPPRTLDEIDNIMKGIDLKVLTTKKAAKLVKFKKVLKENPDIKTALLAKSNIDKLKELERLEKEGLSTMSDFALENINRRLSKAVEEGKKIAKKTEELQKIKLQKDLDILEKTSHKAGYEELKKTPTVPLKTTSKIKRFMQRTANLLRAQDFKFLTVDNVFRFLDNGKREGNNYKILKRPIDIKSNSWLQQYGDMAEEFKKINNKLKLTDEQFEKISIVAYRNQVGLKAKMIKEGIDKKLIESIKLNAKEKKMYDFMRENLDSLTELVDAVLRKVEGKRLDKVENYFPIQSKSAGEEISQSVLKDYSGSRAKKGFTKERSLKTGKTEMRLNAMEVYLDHIKKATFYIHLDETLKNTGKVINSDRYEKIVGKIGRDYLDSWIKRVSRNGTRAETISEKFLGFTNKNLATAVFGFKVATVLKQPLAIVVSMHRTGRHALQHAPDFIFNMLPVIGNDFRKYIHRASSEARFRQFDDPAFEKAISQGLVTKAGLITLKTVDSATNDYIWYTAYRKYFSDNKIKFNKQEFLNGKFDKEGVLFADSVAREINGSTQVKDMARIVSKDTHAATRSLFMFQNFVISVNWNILRTNVLSKNAMNSPLKAATALFFLTAASLAEQEVNALNSLMFGTEASKKWHKNRSKSDLTIDVIMNNIPLASNYRSVTAFEGTGVPALDTIWQPSKAVYDIRHARTDKERDMASNKLLEGIGKFAGIPGTLQGMQIYKKFLKEQEKKRLP